MFKMSLLLKYISKLSFVLMTIILISCMTTSSSTTVTTKPDVSTQINELFSKIESDDSSYAIDYKNDPNTDTVQVLIPDCINFTTAEATWLPGQIQDKLKSNIQDYLGLRTVVDALAEEKLKEIQSDSESNSRDDKTAIELGKITTAKYGLFSKIRKTDTGYCLIVDYTDLTTGIQRASVTSDIYKSTEELYNLNGAVDKVTLKLADKLGIRINYLNRKYLETGSSDFSLDNQLAMARQNELQYQRQMKQYDADLKELSMSNDLSAIENRKKVEAEKALLMEKQKSEQKRLEELLAQKKQAESDAQKEVDRSEELKSQRDKLAKEASAKAAEARKLKVDNLGILAQIGVIENKKKALVEIYQKVENQYTDRFRQNEKDKKEVEYNIWREPYITVEIQNGKPTDEAIKRRWHLVAENTEKYHLKFNEDCKSIKSSANPQITSLKKDINADLNNLTKTRKVSSVGEDLKVVFQSYDSVKYGWNTHISHYSDGVLLFSYDFIIDYKAMTGKKVPNIVKAPKNDMDDYNDTVEMYNSLLSRGIPVIYIELTYSAKAEDNSKPSQYSFTYQSIRVIDTFTGKTVQSNQLATKDSKITRKIIPAQDLRWSSTIIDQEFEQYWNEKKKIKSFSKKLIIPDETYILSLVDKPEPVLQTNNTTSGSIKLEKIFGFKTGSNINNLASSTGTISIKNNKYESESVFNQFSDGLELSMLQIPDRNFEMLRTEITQKIYLKVIGNNPSNFRGDNLPVEQVSWYDAINFCNALSKKFGLTEVYTIKGKNITWNIAADGFRLPTAEEWEYSARGGEAYIYAGSDNVNEVAWYSDNSGRTTHPVGQKAANAYGLYDMSGNVCEWCWDFNQSNPAEHYIHGGSWYYGSGYCNINDWYLRNASIRGSGIGFRIVRDIK